MVAQEILHQPHHHKVTMVAMVFQTEFMEAEVALARRVITAQLDRLALEVLAHHLLLQAVRLLALVEVVADLTTQAQPQIHKRVLVALEVVALEVLELILELLEPLILVAVVVVALTQVAPVMLAVRVVLAS
jgi:hypothetical protein